MFITRKYGKYLFAFINENIQISITPFNDALINRLACHKRSERIITSICIVLILVDCFLRYAQLDKMAVFFVLYLINHLCFIS